MIANWLFSTDDFFSLFGFPLFCLFVILIWLASVKKNDPQRWERINAGQDKDVETAKKVAVTTVKVAAKVIGNVLKK